MDLSTSCCANKCNIDDCRTERLNSHPNDNVPPFAAQYEHSDHEDTPESISPFQSKKDFQKLEADRRIAEAIQHKARKEKNRELDRKLKERSVINTDTGNRPSKRRKSTVEEEDSVEQAESSDGRNKANVAEERMKRAIQEAEDEDRGSFTGDDQEHSDEKDDSVSEAEANPDHTIPEAKPPKTLSKPHHLPDELFETAFSSKVMKRKVKEDDVPLDRPPKKRRSSKSKSKKDIIVGSRTIRVIPDSTTTPSRPSPNVSKFLSHALALEPGRQSFLSRGWERRPVNIGVLRKKGPTASFVRRKK